MQLTASNNSHKNWTCIPCGAIHRWYTVPQERCAVCKTLRGAGPEGESKKIRNPISPDESKQSTEPKPESEETMTATAAPTETNGHQQSPATTAGGNAATPPATDGKPATVATPAATPAPSASIPSAPPNVPPQPNIGPTPLSSDEVAKIPQLLEYVVKIGQQIFDSKAFNCDNIAQARMLALHCYLHRCSMHDLSQVYWVIVGRLSMKSDVMLARFNEAGGDHKILSRTHQLACIELSTGKGRGKQTHEFSFSWADAAQEKFPWNGAGNKGKVSKFLADGSPNPDALKDNWATDRGRMQMLWARVVSDGIRAVMPSVNGGYYTPEEVEDVAEDHPTTTAPIAPATAESAPPAKQQQSTPAATAQPPSQSQTQQPAQQTSETMAPGATAQPAPADAPQMEASSETLITQDQLRELVELIPQVFGEGDDGKAKYKYVLKNNYEVDSAKQLTFEQANKLIGNMQARVRKLQEVQHMNDWANGAVRQNLASGAKAVAEHVAAEQAERAQQPQAAATQSGN